jgi:sec-independent protein translocase protein TatB
MFDIGISHLVVIAIVGILVLGPEKLPGFIRDAVRVWRTLRGLATDAQLKITGELLPDVSEEVRSLHPRQLAAHLLLGDDTDPHARPRVDPASAA